MQINNHTKTTLRRSIYGILGLMFVSSASAFTAAYGAAALPTIASASETSITTPVAASTFTITGTNFVSAARRQRGSIVESEEYGPVSSTVNSATQITVNVPRLEAVSTAITLHLYVNTPGVGRSAAASDIAFTINPPVQGPPPTLLTLSETSVNTPTSAFTFTVTGTNFVASTASFPFHTEVVSAEWGELSTTVNSSTQLTVNMRSIPKVKTAVVLHLYVENPDGTQSSTASELTFTINPPVPGTPPTLTAVSETSVTTPVRHATFTVTGTGFVSGRGERNQTMVYSEEYGELDTIVTSATSLTVNLGNLRKVSTPIVLHLYILNPDGTRSLAAEDIAFTIN